MTTDRELVTSQLYNLILARGTRSFERQQLQAARHALEAGAPLKQTLADLQFQLRPLAWRDNLTPDVADFYAELTGDTASSTIKQPLATTTENEETAIFAGGCFWCMVEPFETHPGINRVTSGYTGGTTSHPTYDEVLAGGTGHVEAVEIKFDPTKITYEELVTLYWQISDPTDDQGQFQDRGPQYRPAIFVQNQAQETIATASKQALIASGRYRNPIITPVSPAQPFWPAENYHQQFYLKQSKRYKAINRARNQLRKTDQLQNQLHHFIHR